MPVHVRKQLLIAPVVLLVGLLSSCSHSDTATSDQPHATVTMRDGTTVSGTVTASSPSQITLAGDDKVSHIIAMKDVKSVAYDEPSAAETSASNGSAPKTRAEEPAREEHFHPSPAAIRTKTYTVPAGAEIPVRSEETIDSGVAVAGQTYAAQVTRDVVDANGDVVIPRGSNAQIVIRSASKGGRIKGAADLALDLASVSVGGQQYELETADYVERGREGVGKNRRTAEFTGGGAAIGAIIGAIAGGGKGAAIGAASGAGAGAATQVLTRGGSIKVPAETVLTFKLEKTLKVVAQK
jgi:hypothetical protein